MKFKKVKLYVNNLSSQKEFYSQVLGFEIKEETSQSFTVQVGWTSLTFEKGQDKGVYHYCFLIPANKLEEALRWMEERVEVLSIEPNRKVQEFPDWNAESFYFEDGDGNIAECIIRRDLRNTDQSPFDLSQLLCVNEVGLPTLDIKATNNKLASVIKTTFWKGDFHRFGAHGNDEGIFLMPNYTEKSTWFPTTIKIDTSPFEVVVENNDETYFVTFSNEELHIK